MGRDPRCEVLPCEFRASPASIPARISLTAPGPPVLSVSPLEVDRVCMLSLALKQAAAGFQLSCSMQIVLCNPLTLA